MLVLDRDSTRDTDIHPRASF